MAQRCIGGRCFAASRGGVSRTHQIRLLNSGEIGKDGIVPLRPFDFYVF
jgi:hypothetical protein